MAELRNCVPCRPWIILTSCACTSTSRTRRLPALKGILKGVIEGCKSNESQRQGWYLVLDYCNCGDLSRLMEDYKEPRDQT